MYNTTSVSKAKPIINNSNTKSAYSKSRSASTNHYISENNTKKQSIKNKNEAFYQMLFFNNQNFLVIKVIINLYLNIQRQFFYTHCTLSINYQIKKQNQNKIVINQQQVHNIKQIEKIIFKLKQNQITIIKKQIKHFHILTNQILKQKNLLIYFQYPFEIKQIIIQNDSWPKSLNIQKYKILKEDFYEKYLHKINPYQFIQEGIKLRALKFQSTGDKKRIVWGQSHTSSIDTKKRQVKTTQFNSVQNNMKGKVLNFVNCAKKLNFTAQFQKGALSQLNGNKLTTKLQDQNQSKPQVIHFNTKQNQKAAPKCKNIFSQIKNTQKPVKIQSNLNQKKKKITYKSSLNSLNCMNQNSKSIQNLTSNQISNTNTNVKLFQNKNKQSTKMIKKMKSRTQFPSSLRLADLIVNQQNSLNNPKNSTKKCKIKTQTNQNDQNS